MSNPGPLTTEQTAAALNRAKALDRLRSLLGPAFSGATVTTDYGGPSWGTGQPHTGIDLAAAEGTPIREPIGGRVEKVFSDNVGGHQVVIKTAQGYREVYAHLSSIPAFLATNPNVDIPAGSIIGYTGQTGMASGPHLHYEITKPGGEIGTLFGTLDPLTFISEFSGGGPTLPPDVTTRGLRPSAANDYLIGAGRIQAIKDEVNVLAQKILVGFSSPSDAAARLKRDFPDVPASTLQEIAYGRSKEVGQGFGDPLSNIADAVNRLTGDLTNPQTWARLGLTLAAVALIGIGVVMYVGSAAPRPRLPV